MTFLTRWPPLLRCFSRTAKPIDSRLVARPEEVPEGLASWSDRLRHRLVSFGLLEGQEFAWETREATHSRLVLWTLAPLPVS